MDNPSRTLVPPVSGYPVAHHSSDENDAITNAAFPVILAGMRSSSANETTAIRKLAERTNLPVLKHSKVLVSLVAN